jgi:hypothetical protein
MGLSCLKRQGQVASLSYAMRAERRVVTSGQAHLLFGHPARRAVHLGDRLAEADGKHRSRFG